MKLWTTANTIMISKSSIFWIKLISMTTSSRFSQLKIPKIVSFLPFTPNQASKVKLISFKWMKMERSRFKKMIKIKLLKDGWKFNHELNVNYLFKIKCLLFNSLPIFLKGSLILMRLKQMVKKLIGLLKF